MSLSPVLLLPPVSGREKVGLLTATVVPLRGGCDERLQSTSPITRTETARATPTMMPRCWSIDLPSARSLEVARAGQSPYLPAFSSADVVKPPRRQADEELSQPHANSTVSMVTEPSQLTEHACSLHGSASAGLAVGWDVVEAEMVGEVGLDVVGEPVGSEVVGDLVEKSVGTDVVGAAVGAAVVGADVGFPVGSEVGGLVGGGVVGSEVGSRVVGGRVGGRVGGLVGGRGLVVRGPVGGLVVRGPVGGGVGGGVGGEVGGEVGGH